MKKIEKRICSVLALLMILCAFSSCSLTETPQANQKRTIVDMAGRKVELPIEVNSYVALWVGTVPLALMLDHGDHMVGCSDTASYYPLFQRACGNFNNLTYFNNDALTMESILETGAEVVFYRGSDHADLAEKLSDAGIAAVDLEFNTYGEMMNSVRIMANVLNNEKAREVAESYIAYANETIERAKDEKRTIQKEKSAIVIRDTTSLRAYGVNRFAGKWVTLSGGEYALKEGDPDGYVNLTSEQLFELDPDYIIFVIPDEARKFASDSKWGSLKAVRNNHVYENPSAVGTWSNHGTEFVLQFWWAFNTMYPEQFDYDLYEIVRDFYLNYYDIKLTNEEIESLINVK